MNALWCPQCHCWIVRHPRRWFDVIATGRTKAEAEAQAERYLSEERGRIM